MSEEFVYIESVHTDEPVFHLEYRTENYNDVTMQTGCGRWTKFSQGTLRLPRRWAEKFATACSECFQ